MAQFPALPLWTDAYLGDTMHLSLEEHGAYLKLLIIAWRSPDCAIPDDDDRIAVMLGIGVKKWAKLAVAIKPFFTLHGGYLRQKRLLAERFRAEENSNRQRDHAKARWLKSKETDNATAMPPHMPQGMPLACHHIHIQERKIESTQTHSPTVNRARADQDAAVDAYNAVAERCGLPRCMRLTPARRSALAARLAECGGIDTWRDVAMAKLEASPFLRGENDRGWKADFGFITRQEKFTKLMEGRYDGTNGNGGRKTPEQQRSEDRKAIFDALAPELAGLGDDPTSRH